MATRSETESCTDEKKTDDNADDSFLLMSYLDEVEDRVERLRRSASALLQEKESLVTVLSQLKEESLRGAISEGEYQEIVINIDRLQKRCKEIEITIHTSRTPEQESSFSKVNHLVKKLEHTCILGNPDDDYYRRQAESYLNACISDASASGPIDYKFQGIVLGCKLEDQKRIRHRLECLAKGTCHVDFIDKDFEHHFPDEELVESNDVSENDENSSPNEQSSNNEPTTEVTNDNIKTEESSQTQTSEGIKA